MQSTENVVRDLTNTISRLTNHLDTDAIAHAIRNALAPLSAELAAMERARNELEAFIVGLKDTDHLNIFTRAPMIDAKAKKIEAHREALILPQPKPGDTVPFGQVNAKIIFTMNPDGTEWKPDDKFSRRPYYRGEALRVEGSPGMWRQTDAARAIADTELVTIVEVLNAPLG